MNDAELKAALSDWYSTKDYESWAKQYPAQSEQSQKETLNKQNDWCRFISIEGTPTILVNGRKLPKPYLVEDIQYFI